MKKLIFGTGIFLLALLFNTSVFALSFPDHVESPGLNVISYQQQVEKWVTTSSAKVTLSVNVTSSEKKFDVVQQRIMKKLEALSEGKQWNIYQFTLTKDPAGLESLNWQLSIRLPLTIVNNLKQKIDALSEPGEQYKIQNIDFQPSLAEKQKMTEELRQQIYNQVKLEIKRLNSLFSQGQFFVHTINFIYPAELRVVPVQFAAGMDNASAPAAVTGSNLTLVAEVQLATKVRGY